MIAAFLDYAILPVSHVRVLGHLARFRWQQTGNEDQISTRYRPVNKCPQGLLRRLCMVTSKLMLNSPSLLPKRMSMD